MNSSILNLCIDLYISNNVIHFYYLDLVFAILISDEVHWIALRYNLSIDVENPDTMILFLKQRITIKRYSDARRMFILCDLPAAYCKKRD